MHNLLKTLNFAVLRNILKKLPLLINPVKASIKKYYDIINPIVVLTAICLIVAAALSLTNSLTEHRIATINAQNRKSQMAALIPADSYNEGVVMWESADPNLSIYEAKTGEETTGYIITTTAKGYSGEIVVMTAFNPDKSLKGISILNADNETPGLGQNITKPDFYSQFSGLNTNAQVVKNSADNSAGEIKAVTGATVSSKGVVNAVNSAREELNAYLIVESVGNTENETVSEENGGGQVEE